MQWNHEDHHYEIRPNGAGWWAKCKCGRFKTGPWPDKQAAKQAATEHMNATALRAPCDGGPRGPLTDGPVFDSTRMAYESGLLCPSCGERCWGWCL